MKKKILILCRSDIDSDPRPNRMIKWLRKNYDVSVMARAGEKNGIVNFYQIPVGRRTYLEQIKEILYLKLRLYYKILWTKELIQLSKKLKQQNFDLIIVHNLDLVPLAVEIKNDGKILFDAREYYPKHFEDKLIWKFFYQSFNEFICANFLKKCDKAITVSVGISEEYKKNFGVSAEVVKSLADFYDFSPSDTNEKEIKIIHHGNATVSRKIELMIQMMDLLDDRFTLDLMLIPKNRKYFEYLKKETKKRSNVKIIPPVKYEKIVSFLNEYDIGLYLLLPENFNQKHALPNKFFEFIQARLVVAIGPSIEMAAIIKKYNSGIVSKEFNTESLARELKSLTIEKIRVYKENSNVASRELNSAVTEKALNQIVKNLLE